MFALVSSSSCPTFHGLALYDDVRVWDGLGMVWMRSLLGDPVPTAPIPCSSLWLLRHRLRASRLRRVSGGCVPHGRHFAEPGLVPTLSIPELLSDSVPLR